MQLKAVNVSHGDYTTTPASSTQWKEALNKALPPSICEAHMDLACSRCMPTKEASLPVKHFFVSRALVSLSLSVTGKKRREG